MSIAREIRIRSLVAVATLSCLSAGVWGQQPVQRMATYPSFPAGQTTYIVPPNEANLIIDTLTIPSGHTLQAGAGVTSINWRVTTLSFGTNATVDLSSLYSAPNGVPGGGFNQAYYCVAGVKGQPGGPGSVGGAGVDFTISGLTTVDTNSGQGSLWIKTDGGNGGAGGVGGRGQQGGGPKTGGVFGIGNCGGAVGGPGGDGGSGGAGGHVAKATFVYAAGATPVLIVTGVAATCGASQRPPAVQGATGKIVVWGATGCPGARGPNGQGGQGG
jgi:hypothetical protein